MSRLRAAKGFTLIELMLVVAIIGLLSAIGIPKFGNMIDKSREAAIKGNLGNLRSALSLYYVDNEGFYPYYDQFGGPVMSGIYLLHGKYIDLNSVKFNSPRYPIFNLLGITSANAMDLYTPYKLTYQAFNTSETPPNPQTPVYYASPFPSYFVYGPYGQGYLASIGMYPLKATGGDLLDTSGRAWSLW